MALQYASNFKFAFPANDSESAWRGGFPQEKLCSQPLAHDKGTELSASVGQPKPKKREEDGSLGQQYTVEGCGKLGARTDNGRMV